MLGISIHFLTLSALVLLLVAVPATCKTAAQYSKNRPASVEFGTRLHPADVLDNDDGNDIDSLTFDGGKWSLPVAHSNGDNFLLLTPVEVTATPFATAPREAVKLFGLQHDAVAFKRCGLIRPAAGFGLVPTCFKKDNSVWVTTVCLEQCSKSEAKLAGTRQRVVGHRQRPGGAGEVQAPVPAHGVGGSD